jgi:pimeloyl-ACP methyl ester carboxylesterase
MQIIDCGSGAPIVMIPGIQGRWEYMRPAIDALAESFRVITFPLCGERGSRRRLDPTRGLDDFVDQIDAVLDDRHLARATICGVSFGGLIALRFAARRPDRTSGLVLVSPPGPSFRLRRRHRIYVRLPRILGPVFLAEVPRRVRAEIALAIPDRSVRRRFAWRQIATFARAPLSLSRMAARARLIGIHDQSADCERILAPTLVVTGEPSLDHVVSAEGTSEYLHLIHHACAVRLEQTGHLGYITHPREFAARVREFLASNSVDEGGPPTGAARVLSSDRRLSASKNDAA